MKTVVMLAAALVLITVAAVSLSAPETEAAASDRWQVVYDVSQQEMVDSHQPMMELMRGSMTPQMVTLMPTDPMRTTLTPT
jgi:hypothetical protein